jgi:hypothetical protein
MNKAEYLSVLVSIIIGMGLSHLLASLARLIVARARVRIYWVSLVTAAVAFLAHVQFWWSTYDYDEAILGNFFSFLVFLLAPILLYLMAVLVFPDFDDDVAHVSMYDHYYSVRPWFYSVGAAAVAANVVRNVAVQGAPLLTRDRPFEAPPPDADRRRDPPSARARRDHGGDADGVLRDGRLHLPRTRLTR